jgi:large subunit ribosomal protein L24e
MVERRVCTFCGEEIEPGTGRMYIKKDGVVFNFCTSKCFKNMIQLGRVPRRTTWTQYYAREKQIRMKGAPAPVAEAPRARKVKKAEPKEEPKPAPEKEKPQEAPKEEKPKAEEKKAPAKEPAKKVPAKKAEAPKKPEGAKAEKPKPRPEPKPKPEEGSKA